MEAFTETQRLAGKWWKVALILAAFIAINIAMFGPYFKEGTKTPNPVIFLVPLLVLALCILLFVYGGLETRIDETGVRFRYRPFHRSFHVLRWEEIASAEVRKYKPLAEYGGWGLKSAVFGQDHAFNVAGNMGLQLVLASGKRILVGTQQAEKLKAYLAYLRGKYGITALHTPHA
jgi:hypothetical protein